MRFKALLLSVAFLAAGCTSKDEGKFNVVNKATEPIDQLEISICGQTSKFSNLKPGDVVSGSYGVKADSHFTIVGQFKSGKKINKEDGYVTNGFDYSHEIEVGESDVAVKGAQVK